MNINTSLSGLKVINEMMKLLNNIEVYTVIVIRMCSIIMHTTYMDTLLYDNYAGILEYPISTPIVEWQVVYVAFTQLML